MDVLIPLGGKYGAGKFAIADESDRELLLHREWTLSPRGYPRTSQPNGNTLFMHVLILGKFADHKNGNPLDNRRCNLREATRSQNNANRCGWSSCGFKGVKSRSDGRFVARIQVAGKLIHLGTFATAEEAAGQYDAAAIRHFGEFARTNFPQEQYA